MGISALLPNDRALNLHTTGIAFITITRKLRTSVWMEASAPIDIRSLTNSVCPDSAACATGVYPVYIDNDTINTNISDELSHS